MNKKTLRIIVDVLIFISMCFITGTGLLIRYRLVPGSRGGHGLSMLNFTRHEWGDFHLWAAYILLFLIVVHLVLNFAFIKNAIAFRKIWIMVLLGMIGLLIILSFFLVPLERKAQGEGRQMYKGSGRQGHGQMRGRR